MWPLLKQIVLMVLFRGFGNFKSWSLDHLKIQALKSYLKFIQTSRDVFLTLVIILFALGFFFFCLALIIVGILMILPITFAAKAFILIGCGGAGFLGMSFLLACLSSEKNWLRLFKVQSLLDGIRKAS